MMVAGRIAGAAWFRMIFFLPYILADVAAGLIWHFMFDGSYGLPSVDHRSASALAPYLPARRQDLGVQRGADRHPVEIFRLPHDAVRRGPAGHRQVAARGGRDGRREPFQRFWHITLPLLGPMIRLSIFFSVVGALQLFDVIVPLTGGGPFETTNTMVSFLYYFGITRMRVGFGSAVGVVLFMICVTFAFGYRRLFMRDD